MNKNLQSPTKLTEFAPLQPEEKQQGVTQFISKIFKLNRSTNNTEHHVNVPENSSEKLLQESLPAWAIETTSESENSQNENSYSVDMGEGRSLPNVLKRISSLLALKSSNLQAYSDSELKQYWMPDSVSKECYECCERFTTFRRRHHCRVCGQIFCAQCCNGQIPGKLFGCTGYLRGCTYCCNVVLSYLKSVGIGSELSACLKALQDSLENKYGIQSEYSPSIVQASLSPVSSTNDIIESGGTLKRKVSVGYQEEKFAPGSSSVNYITIEERCRALQNSVSLRNLYEEICKPTTGIILRSHKYRLRTYSECFLGSELVDWLIRQQKANTRVQAAAICQALLEGGYIECVSDPCSFVDGYALYKPGSVSTLEPLQNLSENSSQDEPTWVQFVSQESSLNETENEPLAAPFVLSSGRLTSSSSYTLDLNIGASTVYLSKPLPSNHSISSQDDGDTSDNQKISAMETSVVRTTEQREDVPESGWHNPTQLREENGERNAYHLLEEAFKQHESSLVKQLLNQHGLQLSWSDTLLPLIHEIVDYVHPDLHHNAEFIDIRQYVKFKKLPGGVRSDCKLIRGTVCTKNIAHKAMPSKIENPKILLLLGSIVYQRIEGRLMSLEPVLMQEHESLRNIATRITNLKPDIVLVERNVARLAQDILREQGVTLVLNVKQRVLDSLSRCTQATLVASVDSHIGKPTLGTCKYFYLKSFRNDLGDNKTLMFFENVPQSHLCGTILLRGASYNELVKVKKVASLLLFACYNWRLEKSFLMDEFAQPPNAKDEFFDESREGSPTLAKPPSSIENEADALLRNRKISKGSQISNLNIFDENENDTEVFVNTEDTKPKIEVVISGTEEKKIVSEVIKDYTDPLHSYNKEDEIMQKTSSEKLSVADLPFSNHFRKHLDDTILCISPFLVFSLPYLETENGRKCKLRSFFPEQIYYSEQFLNTKRKSNRTLEENSNQTISSRSKLKPPHPFTTARITGNVDSNEIQTVLAHFRACGGRLEKKSTLDVVSKDSNENLKKRLRGDLEFDHIDVLDPNNHQKLAVLFCSYSHKSHNAPAFCVYPWIVHMGFYGSNDIPLGCFLERYCFRTSYDCQSDTCGTPMLNHTRRFVHNSGCVSISLDFLDTKLVEDKIIMWSWCSKCQTCSPSVPMSRDTWSFSFAKFLELKFHGSLYTRRGNIVCSHNLHHDNIQYFSYNNLVASFEFSHIQLWEISLPPPVIKINYTKVKDYNEMVEEIKTMALKGHEIFSLISEKLLALPNDFDGLSNLKQILSKEQVTFKQKVEEVQLKLTSPSLETAPDNFPETSLETPIAVWRVLDALIRVKRLIVEAVEQWNMRLSESFKKRDIDKKKDKTSHADLESPITPDSRSLNNHLGDSDTKHQNTEITTNAFTKKIKSLDQSDAPLLDNRSDGLNIDITISPNDSCYVDKAHAAALMNSFSENSDDIKLDVNRIARRGSYNNSLTPSTHCKDYTPPSPKCHHRSQSDGTVLSQYEDFYDNKKDLDKKIVKTIFQQLLPSSTASIPIPLPFNIQEHYTLPTGVYFPIVVFESEPSSVIAYALNSFDYKRALEDLTCKKNASNEQTPSPIHKRYLQTDKEKNDGCDTITGEKSSGLLSFLRTKDMKSELTGSISTQSDLTLSVEQSVINDKPEDPKKNKTSNIEIQFEDSNCKFFCRIYFAEKFSALRNVVLPIGEEAYIRSLARSVPWNARGGKSGSTFCKTTDDRFILKEMPKSEIQLFLEFAPKYFTYMNRCHDTAQPTLLGKIVGIYQVVFKNNTTNATLRSHLLVMENLFYNRIVTQKFDLKGSMRNRLVNPDNQDGEIVLLDENLLKMSCDSPLYVLPHSKAVLTAAIQNDTEFLSAQSVMDYSLLVGLDIENKELVVGIIDYIRTFTWDKKLETMVKKSGMLWGQAKLPTIVSPKEYCKRFIEAMHRYFLEVPDPWTGLGKGLEC
ncbi:FYVE zinc finger [Popillia japonica]|uniref:1-phosphatidylinositol-3-phosphate 5-kinase n=1 Tax=Popillia japonica TaxID=7064 RepID=A0AAW1MLC3_POPJA